jgi:hypothetical protein
MPRRMCHYNEVEWETFNEKLYAAESENEEGSLQDAPAPDEERRTDPRPVANPD